MDIYARISYKHYPYLNDRAEKTHSFYKLIEHNGKMYWEKEEAWSAYKIDFNYMFYVCSPPSTAYIQFEEWHLTKLATRYHKYKEINKERQNEISNRPT